jgi:diguanylate cyclase (GGDEF)-like protein
VTVPLLLLLLQGFVLFGAMLAAFSARRVFGLAPLFLVLGLSEGLKYFVATSINIEAPVVGAVNLGSAVYFTATLVITLVVFLREGAAAVRPIAWGVMFLSLVAAGLTWLLFEAAAHSSNGQLILSVTLQHSLSGLLVGSTLLFVDIMLVLLGYNTLRKHQCSIGVALATSLFCVVCFDTWAYDMVARTSEFSLAEVLNGIAAKTLFAAFYTAMTIVYLKVFERSTPLDLTAHGDSLDLFSVLTYQEHVNRLQRELNEDALTGAFNRRFLESWLPEQLELNKRRGLCTALLMLDIDHFKSVNDQYGHQVGDVALSHVVNRARSQLRRGDTICRYGGEEFIVVLSSSNWPEALHIAEKIRAELIGAPLFVPGVNAPLVLSVSIGIALSPQDGESVRELLRNADKRLYLAKSNGRNRVEGLRPKLVSAA